MKAGSTAAKRKAPEGVVRDPEIRAALLNELRRRRVLRGSTVAVQDSGFGEATL